MAVRTTKVSSLGEYFAEVAGLAGKNVEKTGKGHKDSAVLWFRAESQFDYSLIPSMFRNNPLRYCGNEQYSSWHYEEDMRTQHYHARGFHYFGKEPSSRIEWLEVMQHHEVSTRLLDWSESCMHSLLFALEPFFSKKSYYYNNTQDINPCVWVLDPAALNQRLFEEILKREDLQRELLREFCLDEPSIVWIMQYAKDNVDLANKKEGFHINHIINLSEISDELHRERHHIDKVMARGEFHPLFYFLGKIFSDGYAVPAFSLPPLAVVQPYHSPRIKEQRGVFTVFPFYSFAEEKEGRLFTNLNEMKISPVSLSFHKAAKEVLHKIILVRPQQIASEMLSAGANENWLYPELPIFANQIEGGKIYRK